MEARLRVPGKPSEQWGQRRAVERPAESHACPLCGPSPEVAAPEACVQQWTGTHGQQVGQAWPLGKGWRSSKVSPRCVGPSPREGWPAPLSLMSDSAPGPAGPGVCSQAVDVTTSWGCHPPQSQEGGVRQWLVSAPSGKAKRSAQRLPLPTGQGPPAAGGEPVSGPHPSIMPRATQAAGQPAAQALPTQTLTASNTRRQGAQGGVAKG